MSAQPANIRIDGTLGERLALSCDFDGAEYHVWIHPETRAIDDATLYKNAPDRRAYMTRKLGTDGATARSILPAMLEGFPAALAAYRARLAAEVEQARREMAAAELEQRIRDAAPALLDACRAARDWLADDLPSVLRAGDRIAAELKRNPPADPETTARAVIRGILEAAIAKAAP